MTRNLHSSTTDVGEATSGRSSPLLSCERLYKAFGGNVAVDDVSFGIHREHVVGVIGPNGAGKTTLFDLLTGFERPDGGAIYFDGTDVSDLAPDERAKRGLVRTFQVPRELSGMTVLDNVLLAGSNRAGERVLPSLLDAGAVSEREARNHETAKKWLEFLDLWDHRDEFAGNLSGGQRKLLELGRALMADPDLLLLDEPTAGVNPTLTDAILDHVRHLREEEGVTVLLIEHDVDAIMSVSDTVIGMVDGTVMTTGTPDEVRADAEFREAFIGGR